jgi:hypothetical protein
VDVAFADNEVVGAIRIRIYFWIERVEMGKDLHHDAYKWR